MMGVAVGGGRARLLTMEVGVSQEIVPCGRDC